MEESNITIGNNKLTDEEVKRNEDFGQLMKKHQQFVRKKKWRIGGGIAAGFFLIVVLAVYFNKLIKSNEEPSYTELEEKGITPIFGIELDKKEFVIESDKGAKLSYNDTEIEIPESAFVDSSGNAISGEVSIFYKEFHTPADFFISGIPMTYDSAGETYHFESAGMFDIRGEQNGIPVFLDKSIRVKLASQQSGNYFNQYFYNEEEQKWQFIEKDKAIITQLADTVAVDSGEELKEEIKEIKSEIATLKAEKPKKKSVGSICIKLETDSNEFPEFDGFKEMLFEIDETDKNFSEELAGIEWDDIKLRKKEAVFELIFFKKFKKTILRTRPVFEGDAYNKALAKYWLLTKNKMDSLTNELDKRINTVSQFNNEVNFSSNLGFFVTRIFEINNFGIYNSDCPSRMPKGQLIAIEYLKKSDNLEKDTLKLKQLYLVEENKNTLYTLSVKSSISYNPNNKSMLWGVTTDDKLVIYKAKQFAKIPLNHKGIYNLEFEVIEKDLYAEKTIKKELEIEAIF